MIPLILFDLLLMSLMKVSISDTIFSPSLMQARKSNSTTALEYTLKAMSDKMRIDFIFDIGERGKDFMKFLFLK